MKENNLVGFAGREQFSDALTELLRTGARQLIQEAVEAELSECALVIIGVNERGEKRFLAIEDGVREFFCPS